MLHHNSYQNSPGVSPRTVCLRASAAVRHVYLYGIYITLLLLFSALITSVNSEDYGDWSNSCHIVLNTSATGANVSGSVSDFPVLIRLDPGNFDYFDETEPGGYDIRFTSSGGTHLPYEIERWVDGGDDADSAWIWVKTDVTGGSSTQYIVMYWGKESAPDSSDGETVFDTDDYFEGVWHLGEDPSGGSGCIIDETDNSNDGTPSGGMDETDLVGGTIGLGLEFNGGSSQYINAGTDGSLDLGSGDFTLSGWFKTTMSSVGIIVGKGGHTDPSYNRYMIFVNGASSGVTGVDIDDGSTAKSVVTSSSYNDGDWYYVAAVRDGTNLRLYIDGSEDGNSPTDIGSYGSLDESQDFRIGAIQGLSAVTDFFTGTIDEVCLSSTARSADWIELSFENQQSSQTLVEIQDPAEDYTWDTETTSGIQPDDGTWGSNSYWTLTSGDGTSLTSWPGEGNTGTFGGSDGTYAVTVSGTQDVDGISFLNSGYTLSSGTIDFGSVAGTISMGSGKSATVSATIAGTGGLSVSGTGSLGTLNLSGTNTYTGVTTLGTYTRLNASTLANGGSNCAIGASSNAASNIVLNGGQLRYTGSGASTDRLFTLGTNASCVYSSGSGALSFTGSGSVAFTGSGTRSIEFGGAYTGSSNSFAPVIGDGTGGATSITKTGSGNTWIFTGNNTYTGTTTISGGTIQIGGGGTSGSIAGPIANNTALIVNRSNSYTISEAITGTGTVTQSGSGTLILSTADFSYTGTTTISDGTLQIGAGGTSVEFASDVVNNSALIINRAGTMTYAGDISGTGTVTSSGSGTLTLSGTHTYSGTTTISDGTVNLTGSTGSSSAVTVSSGATITGTGTTNGSLTVNGTIAPGTSPGTFNAAGGLTFSSSGTCEIEINGATTPGTDYDQIVVTGGVTLGSASLSITFGYEPSVSDAYTIISNDDDDAITGTFSQGSSIDVSYGGSTYTCSISYSGGSDNNDVVVTVTGVTGGYTAWAYSKSITLNTTSSGANVADDVYDFPVLVRLDPGTFEGFANTLDDGDDIRFTKSDGTALSYEIERWADNTGDNDTAEIWVLLDTVYGDNSSQSIVMYWGNGSASSESDGEAVFDTENGFAGVWHLKEDGNTTSGGYYDATVNSYDATGASMTNTSDTVGIIGRGQYFDGSADLLQLPEATTSGLTAFTVSLWVKTSENGSETNFYQNPHLIGTGTSGEGTDDFGLYSKSGNLGYWCGFQGSTEQYKNTTQSISDNAWHYVTATNSGSILKLYKDGSYLSGYDMTSDGSALVAHRFDVAAQYDDNNTDNYFHEGFFDEVVISNTARTADWVKLCYENQKTNQTLLSYEYYSTWSHSQTIILNTRSSGADVSGDVANFPVLLRLNPGNFDGFPTTLAGGADIRFAASNGGHLPYEIERWKDYGNDQDSAEIWVLLDTVYGDSSTSFVMYWGKSGASSRSNGEAVFATSNGFAGVWHLGQESGSNDALDITSNGNDGDPNGSLSDQRTGIIGYCQNFDGDGDYFGCGTGGGASGPFDLTTNSNKFTLSAWVRPGGQLTSGWGDIQGIVTKWQWNGAGYDWELYFDQTSGFAFYVYDGSDYGQVLDNIAFPDTSGSTWYHLTATYDNSTMYLYVNGPQNTASTSHSGLNNTAGAELRLGLTDNNGAEYRQFFKGDIDHVTVSKTNRSSDWVKLCYENQKIDQTLVSFEDYTTWGFSRNITINTDGVISTSNCVGFPLLVRLDEDNFDFNQARDDGEDIRFSKSNGGHLPYQIERWSKTSELAEIWVKVDTVYHSNSSQYIRMYWGKAGVSSKSNGANVFTTSNGFAGVWHLGESSGSAADATANGCDGSRSGNVAQTAGDIGYGQTFDGTDDYFTVTGFDEVDFGDLFTASSWLYLSSGVSSPGALWTKSDGDGSWESNETQFFLGDNGTGSSQQGRYPQLVRWGCGFMNPTNAISADGWHYVTFVWRNSDDTRKIYIDATSETLSNTGYSGGTDPGTTLWIGNALSGEANNDFNGKMDELRFDNVVRSADWITLCFHTQKSDADLIAFGESDEFLPLTIESYAPGGVTDTIGVSTDNWAIRFDKDAGGGIDYLDSAFSKGDQVDANLFYVIFDGNSSASGTGTLTLFEWNTVFAGIRQQVTLGSQPFTIDYYVLGSGRMYVQVELTAASTITNKNLEFRIDNDGTTSTDNTLVGDDASSCEGIVRIDDDDGMYDLILSPYETWSSATTFTDNSSYAGLGNSGFDCSQGMTRNWEFMVDFSHRDIDSDDAETYIDNYRNSDTLSFYAGTPLLEQAWEEHLKGHWSCDEGEDDTAFDISGQGHDGALTDDDFWTTGRWGGGLDLDGSDYVTVGNHSDFDCDNGQTIMAWIKPTGSSPDASDIIFGKYSGDTGYKLTGSSGGKLLYTIGNGTPVTLEGTTALTPGTWYHVTAMENHRRTTLKVFINGEIDNISTGSYLSYYGTNSTDVTIGQGLDGVIDDVRVYNGHLDDDDIKAVYTKGFSPDKGMYSVRASDDNTVHCIMHGSSQQRSLPVLQIKNYWAATTPSYVYLDGEQLSSANGEYIASLDDNRKRLTIAFNKAISSDMTLFIDDNNDVGHQLTGPTKKMYWGSGTIDGDSYFYVKNTSGSYFGDADDNEFYASWNLSPDSDKDGEMLYLHSSVTDPGARIDTTVCTNIIPGTDAGCSMGAYSFYDGTGYAGSYNDVTPSFTYTVEESSTVRVRLRINERQVSDNVSYDIVSRWTLYPTGQFFRYDSIYDLSADPQAVYMTVFFDNQTNTTVYTNTTDIRGSIIYSSGFPDLVSCWLGMKNTSGFQSAPFDEDIVTSSSGATRVGFDFNEAKASGTLAKWDAGLDPFESAVYFDIHSHGLGQYSLDSISKGVQSTSEVISTTTGMLLSGVSATAGDLNGDGFNEQEGAYVIQASDNTVKFTLEAASGTPRYYPAFRITDYLATHKPKYVYTGTDNPLVEGYQYNCYLNHSTRELIIQLDTILTANTTIYISADRTLAVQMSNFEARPGNGCDTLLWRTESEHENLGYRLVRRVNPAFFDSVVTAFKQNDSAKEYGTDEIGVPRLLKKKLLKAADTGWVAVNTELIPGAESGASFGPRDYRYVDHRVHNEVLYEYTLVAVDYDHNEEAYGPVQAMPHYLFPVRIALGYNYPNPFRYATKIRFALPVEAAVSLDIFTLNGRLVRRLITPDRKLPAMYHQVLWDGTDDFGRRVATGPYIYRMTSGRFMKAKLMFMVR